MLGAIGDILHTSAIVPTKPPSSSKPVQVSPVSKRIYDATSKSSQEREEGSKTRILKTTPKNRPKTAMSVLVPEKKRKPILRVDSNNGRRIHCAPLKTENSIKGKSSTTCETTTIKKMEMDSCGVQAAKERVRLHQKDILKDTPRIKVEPKNNNALAEQTQEKALRRRIIYAKNLIMRKWIELGIKTVNKDLQHEAQAV